MKTIYVRTLKSDFFMTLAKIQSSRFVYGMGTEILATYKLVYIYFA